MVKKYHRNHIGTGNKGFDLKSGFSSGSYRKATQSLLYEHMVSSAMQLNFLAYAFLEGFQSDNSEAMKLTDESFLDMEGVKIIRYIKDNVEHTLTVNNDDWNEIKTAYKIARTGKWVV